jgi:4-hydroxybenzoate polyprenyltransferase
MGGIQSRCQPCGLQSTGQSRGKPGAVMMTSDAQGRVEVLCVDLDGTLSKTDTLLECFLLLLRNHTFSVFALPFWLRKGKAFLKHKIASMVDLDPCRLPYRQDLLEYLRREKARGRKLVLATAANGLIAEKVTTHLQLFDEFVASDARCNLKGSAKAGALSSRYGEKCFSYAGNARSDLVVWSAARSAIAVDVAPSVLVRIPEVTALETVFPRERDRVRAFLTALRPYQWVKNLLVFVPLLTAGAFTEMAEWGNAGLVFAAFCLTASGLYLLNDLLDVHADRGHASKKMRPFASGELSIALGLFAAPLMTAAGVWLSQLAGGGPALLTYAVTSILYSAWLKKLALFDIFTLAALYSLRLFAGGSVTGHAVSFWLLGFSSFFFLSLAIIKRIAELMKTDGPVRGYLPQDRILLQTIGIGAGLVSTNLLALYVQSDTVARQHQHPTILWAMVPLVLLLQCRLWLSTSRGHMQEDPIIYAAGDWVCWAVAAGLLVALFASFVSFY